MPGRFATFDNITNTEYGRQKLAIKESWKPTLDNVVTYEVLRPFKYTKAPVGLQVDNGKYLKGGGTQVTFADDKDWSSARPNKYNDYTEEPKLDVKSKRELADDELDPTDESVRKHYMKSMEWLLALIKNYKDNKGRLPAGALYSSLLLHGKI
ncbi:hypothetical protein P4S63_18270 [Pseudoalteromonas sp. B193]